MKQIAILEYEFLFDPSEAWSSGYEFEKQLADFFNSCGFEAQIVEARGGTGKRVIFLQRLNSVGDVAKALQAQTKGVPASNQIKQVQTKVPPKDFKRFKNPHHPQVIQPKPVFQLGKTNRQKVRMP